MAKITRIKASDGPRKEEKNERTITRKKVVIADKKTVKQKREANKAAEKKLTVQKTNEQTGKKPFILFRPFIALGHYFRDSWRELRQVRWPNRKATWKMVLAVIVYSLLFVVLISVLDVIFTALFNLILNR